MFSTLQQEHCMRSAVLPWAVARGWAETQCTAPCYSYMLEPANLRPNALPQHACEVLKLRPPAQSCSEVL